GEGTHSTLLDHARPAPETASILGVCAISGAGDASAVRLTLRRLWGTIAERPIPKVPLFRPNPRAWFPAFRSAHRACASELRGASRMVWFSGVSVIGLAAFDHVQPELLDGLGVVVDVAAEGPFRGDGDDLHPATFHPMDGSDLLKQLEGIGHVGGLCPSDLAEVSCGLGALIGLPAEVPADRPEDRHGFLGLCRGLGRLEQPFGHGVLILESDGHVAPSEEVELELLCGAQILGQLCRLTRDDGPFRAALLQCLLIEKHRRLVVGSPFAQGAVGEAHGRVRVVPGTGLGCADNDADRLHRGAVTCGVTLVTCGVTVNSGNFQRGLAKTAKMHQRIHVS
ncbi:15142_t:CDS:2, partial [Funneliformis mosseae]